MRIECWTAFFTRATKPSSGQDGFRSANDWICYALQLDLTAQHRLGLEGLAILSLRSQELRQSNSVVEAGSLSDGDVKAGLVQLQTTLVRQSDMIQSYSAI